MYKWCVYKNDHTQSTIDVVTFAIIGCSSIHFVAHSWGLNKKKEVSFYKLLYSLVLCLSSYNLFSRKIKNTLWSKRIEASRIRAWLIWVKIQWFVFFCSCESMDSIKEEFNNAFLVCYLFIEPLFVSLLIRRNPRKKELLAIPWCICVCVCSLLAWCVFIYFHCVSFSFSSSSGLDSRFFKR